MQKQGRSKQAGVKEQRRANLSFLRGAVDGGDGVDDGVKTAGSGTSGGDVPDERTDDAEGGGTQQHRDEARNYRAPREAIRTARVEGAFGELGSVGNDELSAGPGRYTVHSIEREEQTTDRKAE
jgi:hypothetical protein